jgi:hypothetical protein
MGKVAGPLFSFDASGKVGGAIVFAKWKGRPYVRRLVTPSNPKSAKQNGIRAMFGFLGQNWAAISSANKQTWDDQASSKSISPFNAYSGTNQNRWKNGKSPTQAYPAAETGTLGTVNSIAATGGVGEVTVDASLTAENDNWGLNPYRS